jgi:hypothetical protein
MSFALRPERWLRRVRRSVSGSTSRRERRSSLRVLKLEDRVNPVSVANPLVNTPEPNQATLTANYTQSETSTITFGGTVLVSFNDSGSFAVGNHFTGWGRSTDGGQTFTDLGILPGNNDAGDPVFARDATTGRIYFMTLPFTGTGFSLFRSDDGGATFMPPVNIMGAISSPDKEWIVVDNFPGVGQGNVYAVGRAFGGTTGIYMSRSTDGGATFSAPVLVISAAAGNVQGANVTVLPDHSVQAYYYNSVGTPKTIVVKRSTDFGATFSAPITVANVASAGTNGDLGLTRSNVVSTVFRSNAFPQVAVNPVNSQIYLVYANDGAGADKADIIFTSSNDGGNTWSAPITVNTDGTTRDQWQPSIQVTPDGTKLAVGWYDRRLDPNNTLIDYFGRTATISGTTVTFGSDYRVSNQSFLPEFGRDAPVNTVYMGDYDGSVGAADNNFFHFTWADNRLGGPDVRNARVATTATGGEVLGSVPVGTVPTASNVVITFNQPMDPTSFSIASDVVSFTRNGSSILGTLTGFSWLAGNTQLEIDFSVQAGGGQYVLTVGPQILTAGGTPMDDNLNGVNGEVADQYAAVFSIPSPRIVSSTPTGAVVPPVNSVFFNFSAPMDTSSFSIAQDLFSFTGPAGNLLPFVTGFTWVTNQQLRIDVSSQTIVGNYAMTLNPTIANIAGDLLDNNQNGLPGEIPGDRYTASFAIGTGGSGTSNNFGYRWATTPFNAALNIQPGQPGVNSITFAASQDDDFTLVSLGTNTFNFYGTTFTSVNIGTNGIIGFNGGVSAFTNTDLTTSPTQSVFCPLWDDLHIGRNTATDDLVLTQFQDLNSDGIPDQLVVNWRNVHWFNGSSTSDNGVTFQAVLQLNTGTVAGQMIANWVDLDDGSGVGGAGGQNFGASATVGIKTAGSTPATGDPLVVGFNGNNLPVIAQGQAVRIFKNSAPIPNANGPYTVAPAGSVPLSSAGTTDPEGDPLTLIWDLDGDGTFGETGAGATRGDEVGASPTFVANGLVNGNSVQVTLRAIDSNGAFADAMATVNVVGASAPVVTGVAIGDGVNSIQRSKVTQLAVSFDQVISYVGAQTAAYTVVRTIGGVPTGSPVSIAVITTTVSGHSVATITFLDNLDPTQTGSLNDGHFRLTVNHLQITGMTADSVTNFHRFYGDVTGDEHVDIADFGIFSSTFNLHTGDAGFLSYLDKNSDGVIDIFDFGQFSIRIFTTLP